MTFLFTLVQIVQIIAAIGVIILVLLQHGKGADMGAAFGSGASGSVFGATGSANFLSKATAWLAALFFITTLVLAFAANNRTRESSSIMKDAAGVTVPKDASPVVPTAPVVPTNVAPATPVVPKQ